MLQTSHENAEADRDARMLREARLEGQQIIDAINSALQVDGELLEQGEKREIEAAIESLRHSMETERPSLFTNRSKS